MRSNLEEQKRTKIDADGTVVNLRIGHYEILDVILREGWVEGWWGREEIFFIKVHYLVGATKKKNQKIFRKR